MGIDVAYQAIPHDSALLARARVDAEWGQYLQFLAQYGADDAQGRDRDDALFRAFVQAAQALMPTSPQLRERHLSLGRRYDQLSYLLSPERRPRHHTHTSRAATCRSNPAHERLGRHDERQGSRL